MAAAALSRSRGVAGVRTTKGLFFIFTLLSLVSLTSSRIDKDQLEKLKEDFQKVQEETHRVKAKHKLTMATASEFITEYLRLIKPLIAVIKKYSEASPDILQMEETLENIKGLMEKTETYVDEQNVEMGAVIEESEQKLGKLKKCIEFHEEQHAEL